MNSVIRTPLLVLLIGTTFGLASNSNGATIAAANCTLSSVQAAVNAAADGDSVGIPGGSCAWSGGISTNKQIRIEAQNYVPTKGGTMTRSVTITNNSSAPLFSFTSGNSFHVGISGIRFNEGTGKNNHVRFNGSGSKVPLMNDCSFEISDRFGNNPDASAVAWLSLGGVGWNLSFRGIGDIGQVGGANLLINSPRAWNTASTMGALDSNGNVNVYIEDSTCFNAASFPDADDNARVVYRYNTFDGCMGITHGFTSSSGGRHAEYYNNTFQVSTQNRNLGGRYFWLRAGTVAFTDNSVSSTNNGYSAPALLNIGDNTAPQAYPQPRQPGWGHDGTRNVSDPIYIWNQTGSGAYTWGVSNGWGSNVQLNRDIFVNSGPKPGYSKYTYPHPLRATGGTIKLLSPPILRLE